MVAYPDLTDESVVFKALLGHGMFAERLPPCFSSESLYLYVTHHRRWPPIRPKFDTAHSAIDYRATRNIPVPRLISIPHPESYWEHCLLIRQHWSKLNVHNGKPTHKISFCHVAKINDSESIFHMNYGNQRKENEETSYLLGCTYVVQTDITSFFPSFYTHSLAWALLGKDTAKELRGTTSRQNLFTVQGERCWANDLDKVTRYLKDNETNGLLIGPHTSNILSEVVLTQIDCTLINQGFEKTIRYIDDYTCFASSESDALKFLQTLGVELKKYELQLNGKKTRIQKFDEYLATSDGWISELRQFPLSSSEEMPLGRPTIQAFLSYTHGLAKKSNDSAVFNYAIKTISGHVLSTRGRAFLSRTVLQLTLQNPYLLTILETTILDKIDAIRRIELLKDFLPHLFKTGLANGNTDSLSFFFYFLCRYQVFDICITATEINRLIELEDCIPLTLAMYFANLTTATEMQIILHRHAQKINALDIRDKDKYWLFLYEALESTELSDPFLQQLKSNNIKFISFPS